MEKLLGTWVVETSTPEPGASLVRVCHARVRHAAPGERARVVARGVLAGPGAGVTVPAQGGWNPLAVVITPAWVEAALAAAGHADKCRAVLTGAVTTVLVVGVCLYCGEGYQGVIGRL